MPDFKPSIALAPSDTLAAFDRRTELVQSVRWSELMYADHAFGFTMAKLHRLELLAKVRAAVRTMIAEGGTPKQIMAGLIPELQKAGWWGVVTNAELTGTAEPVLVNERRIRNMLATNLRISRAAGKWSTIQALKRVAPYLAYYAIDDDVTRPDHRVWGGLDNGRPIVLPVDHPLWLTHYPPNGWGCRCLVQQLSADDIQTRGLKITTDDELKAMGLMSADGTIAPANFIFDAANGEDYPTPTGIDAGFAYNPGIATLRAAAFRTTELLEEVAKTDFDAAQLTLREIVESPAFDLFLNDPEGRFPVALLTDEWKDRLGSPARVVSLPSGVFGNQLVSHPELTIADYHLLPTLIDSAIRVVQIGEERLIFYRRADGSLMRVVVRYDGRESGPYVVSFHKVQPRDMAAQSRKGDVLFSRDERP